MSPVASAAAATAAQSARRNARCCRIVARRAPQAGQKADDQVVPRRRQAGAATDQALDRTRRLTDAQMPGRAGKATARGDRRCGSAARQLRIACARAALLQHPPCRPPGPRDLRHAQIDARPQRARPARLRGAEVDRQAAPSAATSARQPTAPPTVRCRAKPNPAGAAMRAPCGTLPRHGASSASSRPSSTRMLQA